ncbi:LytTR family DNA-binding domain-containing protein [Ruegeria atlantica]|uniref:LytTR family DNA-binding domain-containing protein n=1 Tax=Ruegeria atlantica TaxID=81569 RepID=UPI00147E3A7F|nr:LytTR family DNA-binding domain-containing protein [Ruegeria atlantica]
MTSKLRPLFSLCSPQRVVAGAFFVPLLAYAFPPFQIPDFPFVLSFLFWFGVMGIAVASTWLARKLIRETSTDLSLPVRELAIALFVMLLFIPSLWVLAWVLFSFGGHSPPGVPHVIGYSALFTAGLILTSRAEPKNQPPSPPTPRLVRRLPASFQGQIYRLTSRNHYVDVVTSEGTFTIRLRLSDAVAEMEPSRGHCAHRSHWVTDDAIMGAEKVADRTYLKLVNGDLIPVSRKYRPMLEDDGLI